MTDESHKKIIKEEFAKQSSTLESSNIFTDSEITEKIKKALDVKNQMTILDLGCGPGILTSCIAPFSKIIVGFDLTPEMTTKAKVRCSTSKNAVFLIGDAECLPFKNDSFDRIVTRLTLHHFINVEKVLSEMYRVLKVGGKAIILDIVSSEKKDEAEIHNALEKIRDPSHVKMLPKSELLSLTKNSGFTILSEDAWVKQRYFDEWIHITSKNEISYSLGVIMKVLAISGINAGIDLDIEKSIIKFNHNWIMITGIK